MPGDLEEPLASTAIVFVHGIGDHKESETLLGFGEPMTDWLAEWLRPRNGHVVIADARLRADRTESESPAYARVEVQFKKGEEPQTTTLLMTEAWWGDTVRPPDSLKLLGWLFYRGPLLIFAHFCLGRKEEAPVFLLRSLYVLPLCAAVQLLSLAAILLWVIPADFIRARIAGAVRILTLTLGDSFVLLEQEFQRAAFVAHVRSAVAWASDRAERVVLIAHSQGGAIAHEAIAKRSYPKLRQFITVGSGLEKLYFLRTVRRDRKALLPAALAAPCTIAWLLAWRSSQQDAWVTGFTGLFGMGLMVSLVLLSILLEGLRDALRNQLRGAEVATPWLDLYATHDLVSAGPRSLLPESVVRRPVVNLRSLLHDHVTYFDRSEDSLPALWTSVLDEASLHPSGFDTMRQRHRWHTLSRSFSFWALLVASISALYVFRAPLAGYGKPLQHALDWLGLNSLNSAASAFERFGLPSPPWFWAAGALLFFHALIWRAFTTVWELCAAARWRRYCRGPSKKGWQLPPSAVPVLLMGLSAIPPLTVAAAYVQLLPATTPRQIGSAFFFAPLYGLALTWTVMLNLGFTGFLNDCRGRAVISLFSAHVIWIALSYSAGFFWRAGEFPSATFNYLQQAAVALVALVWAPLIWREKLRFARLAAVSPLAVALLVFLSKGFQPAVCTALGVTCLSQLAMTLLHAKPAQEAGKAGVVASSPGMKISSTARP